MNDDERCFGPSCPLGIDQRLAELERTVAESTAVMCEVRDLLELGRSGLRLLGYAERAVVWLAKVGAALAVVGAAIYALRYGRPPEGK
jgi:hypothetical protein